MKFLRPLLGITTLDHQRNTTVREKLKAEITVDEIQSYHNWLQRINPLKTKRICFI
jgi:chemotaxis methyl-accepting protein methylase